MPNQIEVILRVTALFEQMQIRYLVGGSIASSLQGFSRATADVDIVADLRPEHVAPLYAALKDEFYLDDQAMRRAISMRSTFNLIHSDIFFKVDVYIPQNGEFSQRQLERARREALLPGEAGSAYVASPEDTVLSKLRWYRRGGGVSERQLSDVLGVLKVQGERLDLEYMREWADSLGVLDLLEQLLKEAGLD
ncbi:MAG TPA: hypothetical protein VNZ44_01730 [Pyrinomonadaceae bacterium]|nr:hypothetical protein [Pyrinomonadaceae bacterium]